MIIKKKSRYKHLIFDFDGVLVESNDIRFEGFQLLFKDFPNDKVHHLIQYARSNGGMSRYEKIRYFFEEILTEPISDDNVQKLAKRYSELVKDKVIRAKPVSGSLEFLSSYGKKYDLAIVSGSDQEELRDICKTRKIDHFFIEILGSPVSKESNIALLLSKMEWERKSCLFIGDSINDLDAAMANEIDFIARDSGIVKWNLMPDVVVMPDLSYLQFHLL